MPAGATYEPIATASPSGTSDITFSSIPGTYTDLRLVVFMQAVSGSLQPALTLNGDTGTNYSNTRLVGDGASATSARQTSQTEMTLANNSTATTIPALWIADLFSYAGSTNKTVLCQASADKNGSGHIERKVLLWRNTAAITTIKVNVYGVNVASGSRITLYGIKAA
jgi:hypothetical protein